MKKSVRWCPRTDSNRGPIDYKSIALPAELQGHLFNEQIFSLKDQINQSLKTSTYASCLIDAEGVNT